MTVCIALLVNICSLPVLLAIPGKLQEKQYAILFALIFPLIGLGLAYWAFVTVMRARRFGKTYLELETFPAHQGAHLKGKILTSPVLGEVKEVKLSLSCERNTRFEKSKGGSEVRTMSLWVQHATSAVILGQSATGEAIVKVDIAIPEALPDSSVDSDEWYTWNLKSSATLAGEDFEAEFEVPVFKNVL